MTQWETVDYVRNGQRVAHALLSGTEIHFLIEPEFRRKVWPRTLAREFLAPLFERRGYLTTRCRPVEDSEAAAFVQRLGFVPTWSDGVYDFFMLTDLPFQRRT